MKGDDLQQVCPICGGGNACEGSHDCWCGGETFPSGLFELVPEELRGKSCICRACVKRFKEEAEGA